MPDKSCLLPCKVCGEIAESLLQFKGVSGTCQSHFSSKEPRNMSSAEMSISALWQPREVDREGIMAMLQMKKPRFREAMWLPKSKAGHGRAEIRSQVLPGAFADRAPPGHLPSPVLATHSQTSGNPMVSSSRASFSDDKLSISTARSNSSQTHRTLPVSGVFLWTRMDWKAVVFLASAFHKNCYSV